MKIKELSANGGGGAMATSVVAADVRCATRNSAGTQQSSESEQSDCDKRFEMSRATVVVGKVENHTFNSDTHSMNSKNDKNREKEFDKDESFLVNHRETTYDVRHFLKHHPGGINFMKPYQGLNLDKIMRQTTHSEAAYHLLQDFIVDNQKEYDDVEKLVDWNAPLLSQVSTVGDNYWKWVNLPVNRPIRLFKSDILELISMTPWYLVPIIWIPVILCTLYIGYLHDISGHIVHSLPGIIVAFLWGVLQWTFLEYVIHKKVFHFKPPSGSKVLITLHFLLHGVHHKAPFDDRRLLFPPVPAMLIATVLYRIYVSIFPKVMLHFIAAGILTGYLCYDLTHFYLHQGAPKAGSYFYSMKRYHNYHHFSNHDEGFGISSRLWDFAFGTTIKLRQLLKDIEW